MPTCPAGHESSSADFCDVCGMRIEGAQPAAAGSGVIASPATIPQPEPGPSAAAPSGASEQCPQCGTDRTGKFCEVCGFDFTTRAPGPGLGAASEEPAGLVASSSTGNDAAWTAVATADRAYFDAVIAAGGPDAASIKFPIYYPERRYQLSGAEVRIGRRSASRGLQPELDLTGPPTDPGISHLHAVLIAQPDGTWSLLDPGSSNGTQVNGVDVTTGVEVPLNDGDRICLGAWTVLEIQAP